MPNGKLDYAYRLTKARLVIVRMRLSRRFSGLLSPESLASENRRFSARKCKPNAVAALIVAGAAGWIGYQWSSGATADLLITRDTLLNKVEALQQSSIIQNTENTFLKNHLQQKVWQIRGLELAAESLRLRLEELEAEKTDLAFNLSLQRQQFADAEERWKGKNTEHRVVYNITNIPVGAHVSEEQIRSDVQAVIPESAASEPSLDEFSRHLPYDLTGDTQVFRYQYGADSADVNSTDPYQVYRDTTGENVGWKGDSYLSDQLNNGLAQGNNALPADITGISRDNLDSAESSTAGSANSSAKDTQQEPFFGPAPDLYENLIEPGMAELPVDAKPYIQE